MIGSERFTVALAHTLRDARRQIALQQPDIVLLDLQLPDGNGMDLFSNAQFAGSCEVVLITGHASLDTSIKALRLGAADYLVKPINLRQLEGVLSRFMKPAALKAEVDSMTATVSEDGHFGHLWGTSAPMRRVYEQVSRVAVTSSHGVHHRRKRLGQGGGGADGARPVAPAQAALPGGQLRGHLAQPDRERDLRPREGQLHRRRAPAPGLLRARQRRHPVPRRDHRDAAGAAGQAAAGAGDRPLHAGGLHHHAGDRRAGDRRHQPRARCRRWPQASCAKTCCTG